LPYFGSAAVDAAFKVFVRPYVFATKLGGQRAGIRSPEVYAKVRLGQAPPVEHEWMSDAEYPIAAVVDSESLDGQAAEMSVFALESLDDFSKKLLSLAGMRAPRVDEAAALSFGQGDLAHPRRVPQFSRLGTSEVDLFAPVADDKSIKSVDLTKWCPR
jgi:hypothetical protein